jgi:hypothetical protein
MRGSRKKLRVDKTQIGAHDVEEHKRHRKNKPVEKKQIEAHDVGEDRGRILPRQWIALEPSQGSGDLHRTRVLTWNVSSLTIA